MKLLVPVSYFRGAPRSELWLLDSEQRTVELWQAMEDSPLAVRGKGVTGVCCHPAGGFVMCDFNRLLHLDATGALLREVRREDLNDLHAITVAGDGFLLANTGRDRIERLNAELQLVDAYDALSSEDWQARWHGKTSTSKGSYYDAAELELPFHLRRLVDTFHLNYAIQLPDGRVMASSLEKRACVDTQDFSVASNTLPYPPHDGLLHQKRLWVTTVNGIVYASELSERLHFEPVVDLFKMGSSQGWCRGLHATSDRLFVGITAVETRSRRTEWLTKDAAQTRTGVVELCTETWQVLHFYDLTHTDGARVFSLMAFDS